MIWNWLTAAFRRVQPRSSSGWGVLPVIASFLLLVIGAAVSVMKGHAAEDDRPTVEGPPVRRFVET